MHAHNTYRQRVHGRGQHVNEAGRQHHAGGKGAAQRKGCRAGAASRRPPPQQRQRHTCSNVIGGDQYKSRDRHERCISHERRGHLSLRHACV